MINPATGLEDPNYKPKLEASIKPLNSNIGGTAPTDIQGRVDASGQTPVGGQSFGAGSVQVNGGPKLNLDVINQYRDKLGAGPQLEHTATPQGAISSVSNVSGGLSNLKEVTTPTTSATTGLTPKTETVTPAVIDQSSGKGATDTFGNQTGQLTPEELQVYNNMTPAEKQQMKADVDAKLATAANYVQTVKKQKDYLTGQEDINKKITDESGKIKEIQSSERIRNAENQLNNLKQNVAYLGTGGKPGVSSVKMDAISRQLANANTTFQNLKAVEGSMKEMQRLGIKFDANQFEKQITDLQDDLDNKVSKQIQNAMNEMTSAEMSGKLDTMEEISAFRTKLFSSLDNQISGVAEVNFTQRAAILKEYADMENKAMEVMQKSKTIDDKMSSAQGFYVDGNGKAVISKMTGLLIPIPKEAPIKPMYDEKTGRLVTFTTDANGKIVASMEDLIQDPTFTQETITNYASLVASGKLKIDDVPESVKTMSGFIEALQKAPTPVEQMTPYQQAQIDLAKQKAGQYGVQNLKDRYIETKDGLFDVETQKYIAPSEKSIVTPGKTQNRPDRNNNPGNVKIGDVGFGVDNQNHTIFGDPTEGYTAMVKDLTDKLTGKSRWGLTPDSTLAQLGKIYAEDPKWSASVAKMSGYSANTKLKDIDVNKLAPAVAKQEGFTGSIQETKNDTPLQSLGQFMKDNQDRGAGYSNDDVKAFNEKIDRLSNAGDEKGMAIAYRSMIMKDKDFKKNFDDTKSFTTALDTVQKLIDDYEKSGKDSNKLKAIAESVGRKLGLTTDTALAQLQTQMGTTMANYIKSISGTAASDAEVTRLMGNMANIGNVEELNTAIISQVKQNALNGIKSMVDTRMYGMPDELKPKVFGDIYNLKQPTAEQIKQATPKVLEDIKAGKTLEEMKQRAISKGTDPAFVEEIWNKNKQSTPTGGRWQSSQPPTQGRWQSNQK